MKGDTEMTAVEQLMLESMENTTFQCLMQDDFEFLDSFINQDSMNKEDCQNGCND